MDLSSHIFSRQTKLSDCRKLYHLFQTNLRIVRQHRRHLQLQHRSVIIIQMRKLIIPSRSIPATREAYVPFHRTMNAARRLCRLTAVETRRRGSSAAEPSDVCRAMKFRSALSPQFYFNYCIQYI